MLKIPLALGAIPQFLSLMTTSEIVTVTTQITVSFTFTMFIIETLSHFIATVLSFTFKPPYIICTLVYIQKET